MKLIFCKECSDTVTLGGRLRKCRCRKSSGRYTDDINVVVSGPCVVLGFGTRSFQDAYQAYIADPERIMGPCCGWTFSAFIIPDSDKSIERDDNAGQ